MIWKNNLSCILPIQFPMNFDQYLLFTIEITLFCTVFHKIRIQLLFSEFVYFEMHLCSIIGITHMLSRSNH